VSRQGYGRRIEQALLDRQSQIGERLTLEWLGAEVGKLEKRKEGAYTQAAVSSWVSERNEPSLVTFKALAEALHTTPEWLAFAVRPAAGGQQKRNNASG